MKIPHFSKLASKVQDTPALNIDKIAKKAPDAANEIISEGFRELDKMLALLDKNITSVDAKLDKVGKNLNKTV